MAIHKDSSFNFSEYWYTDNRKFIVVFLVSVVGKGSSTMSGSEIRNQPDIQNILSRMSSKVTDSFSDEQLINMKVAIDYQYIEYDFDNSQSREDKL
jgi:hypothetical protein